MGMGLPRAILCGAAFVVSFASTQHVQGAEPDWPPHLSALPQLRKLWSVTGFEMTGVAPSTAMIRDGVLIARTSGAAPRALVGIDLRTGKERWRFRVIDAASPTIAFAGDTLIVNDATGRTTALDLRRGRPRWSRPLCRFTTEPDAAAGVAVVGCVAAPGGSDGSALMFEVATGRARWRTPHNGRLRDVRLGAGGVYLMVSASWKESTAYVLDRATGATIRQFDLGKEPPWGFEFEPDGRDVLILYRGGGTSGEAAAVRPSDGAALWHHPICGINGSGVLIHSGGHLLTDCYRWIGDVDPISGTEIARWPLPVPSQWYAFGQVRVMRGELVVAGDAQLPAATWIVRFAHPGAPAKAATARAMPGALAAADDGVLIFRTQNGLEAYDVFGTTPAERDARPASELVPVVLGRHAGLAELREIPGFEGPLVAAARDPAAAQHEAALAAAVELGLPDVASLALAELDRPLTVPLMGLGPRFARPEGDAVGNMNDLDRLSMTCGAALGPRAKLAATLAERDDPRVADRLAPFLRESSLPDGRVDPAKSKLYDGVLYRGMGAYVTAGLCQMHDWRFPELHAAVYRMLARLGRPADLAALAAFDRAPEQSGWQNVCAREDAFGKRSPVPLPLERAPDDLCRGPEAGDYRVTRWGVLWVRRRRPDGTFGPPAWAAVPGQVSFRDVVVVSVEPHEGTIGLHFNFSKFDVDLDPRKIFADTDGDGLTDLTEAAFGTDPARADTDGDGVPDGLDPAPLARPPTDERGRVEAEVIRYANRFSDAPLITMLGTRDTWVDPGSGAGLTLQRVPGDGDIPVWTSAQSVDSVRVEGNVAHADTSRRTLELRRVGGLWRVVGDPAQGAAR
jgi:hypothetical protein